MEHSKINGNQDYVESVTMIQMWMEATEKMHMAWGVGCGLVVDGFRGNLVTCYQVH
jgi:hypothetical protein